MGRGELGRTTAVIVGLKETPKVPGSTCFDVIAMHARLNVNVTANSRCIQRIIAKPLMRCVREKRSFEIGTKTVKRTRRIPKIVWKRVAGRRAGHGKGPTKLDAGGMAGDESDADDCWR